MLTHRRLGRLLLASLNGIIDQYVFHLNTLNMLGRSRQLHRAAEVGSAASTWG